MELRHLRYFVKIAELEHFGRAADRLHVAQPGLSRHMANLEAELGFALFERLARGIRLSPAGYSFLQDCRAILNDVDAAAARARNVSRGITGTLRIAFIESASWHGALPDVLGRFRERYPHVDVSLMPMMSLEAHEALRSKRVDCAFAYYAPLEEQFGRLTVTVNNVMVALPKNHHLADHAALALRDFRDEPLVVIRRSAHPQQYDRMFGAFGRAGFTPTIAQETDTEPAMLSLVSAGIGYAVVTTVMQWRCPANVTLKAARNLSIPLKLELLWRRDNLSPAVSNFLAMLRDYVRLQGRLSGS